MAFKLTNTVNVEEITRNRPGRAPLAIYGEIAEALFDLYKSNPKQAMEIQRFDPQIVDFFTSRKPELSTEEAVPEVDSIFHSLNGALKRMRDDEFPYLRLQRYNMTDKNALTVRCTNTKVRKLNRKPKNAAPSEPETPNEASNEPATV